MKEYRNWNEEYVNGDRYIYDEHGNLIGIEHDDGCAEYPVDEDWD